MGTRPTSAELRLFPDFASSLGSRREPATTSKLQETKMKSFLIAMAVAASIVGVGYATKDTSSTIAPKAKSCCCKECKCANCTCATGGCKGCCSGKCCG